ncbi:MAG: bifunctional phosphopantothenoylcysteine decarboxylase/phosphopantothenate--cysteine ligase CoaBC [Epsilonproteobacteria bacterium]|nr:MAG: bifunctional phosphopantothenoylcysteine decarboxylase/phosphopantothenate--cysteine ligase CoaBC [Campylobacterota bacterium]RLA66718.1 MAG: bifunctional phosphopantothenoylcysteine decarboxylase/phosphopantothenate--cysteine ligase CoaBC [Campylobacterota bacterium]
MKILLSVCGSISAYKSIDIARGLIKEGHQVKVILSKGAEEFVIPQVFKYLGVEEVYKYNDDFKYPEKVADPGTVLHIELAKWADTFAVAPLSANTLANLANGNANDLLTTVFLALGSETTIALYPAMNSNMLTNAMVVHNFEKLKNIFPNLLILPTERGELACGDTGPGKLPHVEKIVATLPYLNTKNSGKNILITTGPTMAPLDSVRFLTNSSSGITGFHLALEALSRGHVVTVIAGANSTNKLDYLKDLPKLTFEKVNTTLEMKECVLKHFPNCSVYISAAAITDIEFNAGNEKLKKSDLMDSLPIKTSPDVLKAVMKIRDGQKFVGFAAEVNLSEEVLREKWERKPVELLIGTEVNNGLVNKEEIKGFKKLDANYKFLKNGKISFEGTLTKIELAKNIMDEIL